jgi:cell fate regulator YaaT (PSP1 superfamily)
VPELVEVRFKGNRKACFSYEGDDVPRPGDAVIVSVERGSDLGRVSAIGAIAAQKCATGCAGCEAGQAVQPTGAVVRRASQEDEHLRDELRKAEDDVRRTVMERARSHSLQMKISDVEWQWDRKKLTVYFTADKRVDFRNLVRDLAALFRTRIELRQIGARDESKRLDGVGRCGRQFCCSSWLPELQPVSLSLAKDQRLSLNPTQISGGCGRLLCCLRYEHDFYVASRKRFPKLGRTIRTRVGPERVIAVDIFRERVELSAEDGSRRNLSLTELKEEVGPLEKRVERPKHEPEEPETPSGDEQVSKERAVESVTPPKRRRRYRRRGRRGGRRQRRQHGDDNGDGKGSDGDA